MRRMWTVAATGALILALSACGGGGTAGPDGGEATPSSGGAADPGSTTVPEPGDVVIVIRDDGFEPAQVTVPATTRLIVRNEGSRDHSLITDDVSSFNTFAIEPGDEEVLYATVPGVYPFHCELHPDLRGTLTIEE